MKAPVDYSKLPVVLIWNGPSGETCKQSSIAGISGYRYRLIRVSLDIHKCIMNRVLASKFFIVFTDFSLQKPDVRTGTSNGYAQQADGKDSFPNCNGD